MKMASSLGGDASGAAAPQPPRPPDQPSTAKSKDVCAGKYIPNPSGWDSSPTYTVVAGLQLFCRFSHEDPCSDKQEAELYVKNDLDSYATVIADWSVVSNSLTVVQSSGQTFPPHSNLRLGHIEISRKLYSSEPRSRAYGCDLTRVLFGVPRGIPEVGPINGNAAYGPGDLRSYPPGPLRITPIRAEPTVETVIPSQVTFPGGTR